MGYAKIIKLESGEGYRRLLNKDLASFGIKCGLVSLKPGQSIGEHTTAEREEIVIVLKGNGEAVVEGSIFKIETNSVLYISPETRHDIKNTGLEILEYIFITSKKEF